MNSIAAWKFFEGVVLKSSAQAAVLVLLVLAVQGLFRRRLSPRWRCALWWLVAARLLLPVSPTGPVSIFNWLRWPAPSRGVAMPVSAPRAPSQRVEALAAPPAPMHLTPASPPDAGLTEPTPRLNPEKTPAGPTSALARSWTAPDTRSAVTWRHVVLWLWGLGLVGLTGHLTVSVFRLRRELRGATPVSEPGVLALLDCCREQMRVRGRLMLLETPAVNSPALCGFWRPRLLLPPRLLTSFTPQELRFVFLHELAHLKRQDIAVNWLTTLLQIVHWFNPFVWFAFHRMRADRELACDALALSAVRPDESRAYGKTIIKLLEGFMRSSPLPGLVGILEDKTQMKRRIRMIAQFRRGGRWAWLSGIAAAVLGIVCLTDAQTGKQGDQPHATGRQTTGAQTVHLGLWCQVEGTPFGRHDADLLNAIQLTWFRLQEKAKLAVEKPQTIGFSFKDQPSGRITEVQPLDSNTDGPWPSLCRQALLEASPLQPWPEDMRRVVGKDSRTMKVVFHVGRAADARRTNSPVLKPAREVRMGRDPATGPAVHFRTHETDSAAVSGRGQPPPEVRSSGSFEAEVRTGPDLQDRRFADSLTPTNIYSGWASQWSNLTVTAHCPPWGCSSITITYIGPDRWPPTPAKQAEAMRQLGERLRELRAEERLRQWVRGPTFSEVYHLSWPGATNAIRPQR